MEDVEMRCVVFLPGGINPASVSYRPLIDALPREHIRPLFKDLELYRGDEPPPGYSLDMEIEGLKQAADDAGMANFHLVSYSAGGGIALAFVARCPERVMSLAITEPNVIPSQAWFERERVMLTEMARIMTLPPPEQMREFVRFHLHPGVTPPPPPEGTPPPWMAKRPAGLKALSQAVAAYDFPLDDLRKFTRPVYVAVGASSNSIEVRKAELLDSLFPDFRLEMYEGRHHFDPPQRAEPERYARALLDLWTRAEQGMEEQNNNRAG